LRQAERIIGVRENIIGFGYENAFKNCIAVFYASNFVSCVELSMGKFENHEYRN
jgi:hypothetical protein